MRFPEGVTYGCLVFDLSLKRTAPPGFEPGTLGLEVKCSIQRAMVSVTIANPPMVQGPARSGPRMLVGSYPPLLGAKEREGCRTVGSPELPSPGRWSTSILQLGGQYRASSIMGWLRDSPWCGAAPPVPAARSRRTQPPASENSPTSKARDPWGYTPGSRLAAAPDLRRKQRGRVPAGCQGGPGRFEEPQGAGATCCTDEAGARGCQEP